MDVNGMVVYVISIVVLLVKHVVTITIQAVERMRTRKFRYPEDAAFWKGVVAEDTVLCQRAQQLLRNDGENHPYYLAIGAAYVVLGVWPGGAPLCFGVYGLSRVIHAYYMLRPRQPHRNRAFAAGVTILAGLSAHLVYAAISRCVRG